MTFFSAKQKMELQRFDNWIEQRLNGGNGSSAVEQFDKDYVAFFGNKPFDKASAIRMFVENEYAVSAFVKYIVIGGVVTMIASGMLCLTMPAQTRKSPRTACAPHDSDSLVAHLGETGLAFLASPTVYAIGTGMLGATLFKDAKQEEGIFETLKYFKRADDDAYRGKGTIVVGGVAFALVCMGAGTFDWNFLSPHTSNAEKTVCDDASDAGTSAPTVYELLTSDVSLLVAVILNFFGDSLMVGECFEYGKLSNYSQIIKILADNTILVVALAMRARQRGATPSTLIRYLGVICGIYVSFLAIGYAIKRSGVDYKNLKAFCAGFVPVVLIWTLLLELAPNTLIFTDDAGFEIPREMRLSTGMTYTDEKGQTVSITASQCIWFNQRELIVSLVTMIVFYVVSWM